MKVVGADVGWFSRMTVNGVPATRRRHSFILLRQCWWTLTTGCKLGDRENLEGWS